MKKITRDIAIAFHQGEHLKISNTETKHGSIWLHGNEIVRTLNNRAIIFTLAGWNTNVTKERLMAIGVKIYNRKKLPVMEVRATHPDDIYRIIDEDSWYYTCGEEFKTTE
tara:strand:+ start:598 stop:927 length:330 start_codon:yes stop_codon:yes gene_type:complete